MAPAELTMDNRLDGEIPKMGKTLFDNLERLDEVVQQVVLKFAPVCIREESEVSTGEQPALHPPSLNSAIAQELQAMNNRVSKIRGCLENLIERCQL